MENTLTPLKVCDLTKGAKLIMNHASFLREHTVPYLGPVGCSVLVAACFAEQAAEVGRARSARV